MSGICPNCLQQAYGGGCCANCLYKDGDKMTISKKLMKEVINPVQDNFTDKKIDEFKKIGIYILLRKTDPVYGNENRKTLQQAEDFLRQALQEQQDLILSCLPDTEYIMMNEAYKTKFLSNLKEKGLITYSND